MGAKYTPKIRPFVASSLIDNVVLQQIDSWEQLTPYIEGTVVYYENNKYVSKASGTSGSIPPTHVNGTATDGGIDWIWVESININEMFKRNVFVFIGKPSEWEDENTPDDPGITDKDDFETIQNIMTLKRVSSGNFRLAIRRHNWLSGTVYSSYDDYKDPLAIDGPYAYEHPFFIFTDENNIYKCIDNNNGAQSTIKPTAVQNTAFVLADGYVWKYMGALDADAVFFLTKDFVPVRYKLTNDGSSQWSVQNAAVQTSISSFKILNSVGTFPGSTIVDISGGSPVTPAQAFTLTNVDDTLRQIIVQPSQIGTGYDLTQDVFAIVRETGSVGTGAEVLTVSVDGSGTITNITFSAGSGYTNGAVIVLVDPTNTPTQVYDIDVVTALDDSISEITINDGGLGYSEDVYGFIIPGDAGAVGKAVFAPKEGHGYNIVSELSANTAIVNIRLTEETDYLLTGESYAFRQVGLITDVVDYTTLEPAYNLIYVGPSHPQYSSGTLNRIDANKGFVLYLNNLKKIVRSEGQEEDLRVAITL